MKRTSAASGILFDIVMNHCWLSATPADMQEFQFSALVFQGDELKNAGRTLDRTGSRAYKPAQPLTTTSTSATKPHGRNGGARNGSARTSAITTTSLRRFDHVAGISADLENGIHDPSGLPNFYQHKPDTRMRRPSRIYPRDYRPPAGASGYADYGIDGFRVDTAKHVELAARQQLKDR